MPKKVIYDNWFVPSVVCKAGKITPLGISPARVFFTTKQIIATTLIGGVPLKTDFKSVKKISKKTSIFGKGTKVRIKKSNYRKSETIFYFFNKTSANDFAKKVKAAMKQRQPKP